MLRLLQLFGRCHLDGTQHTLEAKREQPSIVSAPEVSANSNTACGLRAPLKPPPLAVIFHPSRHRPTTIFTETGVIWTSIRWSSKSCHSHRMNRCRWKVGHYSHHDVPHHGNTGPSGPIKEEPKFENPTEQGAHYTRPITQSRAKLVNLVTYLDSTEACEGDREHGKQLGSFSVRNEEGENFQHEN